MDWGITFQDGRNLSSTRNYAVSSTRVTVFLRAKTYSHFRYYLLSAGESFTHVEDALILEGVKAGYDMADIVLLMGKRTIQEVRIRYKALQSKATKSLASDKPWTE